METTMIGLIRDYCLDNKDVNDIYGCIHEFLHEIEGEVNNWPDIPNDEFDEDDCEPLDLENMEIIAIDVNSITIFAGGDWQEPWRVKINFVPENGFECVEARPMNKEESFNGLSEEELAYNLDLNIEDFE